MKKIYAILVLALMSLSALAQQALWGGGQVVSPKINDNGTVTFSLFAPDAQKVQLTGDCLPTQKIKNQWGSYDAPGVADLTKDDKGLWTYTTTDALSSELYMYNFLVDGVKVTDPSNVYMIRDVSSTFSVFIIGGGKADLYKVNNVPHGSVTRTWYESPSLGMKRRISIYTPAGYENGKQKYPVFYLLHGSGGDEEAWLALGRTVQILDNLIAQGKAKPMIVVMPNGNASEEAAPGETQYNMIPPTTKLAKRMEGSFELAFPDIVNFVDSHYRTIKKKSGRAIAGLSMGGYHSYHISKQYPDMFDYIGLFSAAISPGKDVKSPVYEDTEGKLKTLFAKKPALYYIAIGNADFLYQENVKLRAMFDNNGYSYEYHESENGHIWRNWRDYLTLFAQKLF